MFNADHVAGHLFVALTVFLLATASPGSSNLAIVATAIERGRSHALAAAVGAMSGSLAWGIAATFGVFALLQSQAWSPVFMTVFRRNYLLLLFLTAARSALGAAPTISGS